VKQSIESVIKIGKEDLRTQRFLSWFTQQNGLRPVPYSTVRISLKMIKLIKFTTLAHIKNTLLPVANHCWTFSRPRNHTKPTVCFKNTLAETYNKSQLYRIHCITKKCLTLLIAANHCWTFSRPRNHTELIVCFKNTLAETYSKSQLYRIHY